MGNLLKDPSYTGRIDLNGRAGGGIYMTNPATGVVSTIVDENGNVVDSDPTFNDANLTGTTTAEDVEISGNLTVGGTTIVDGVVADAITFEDVATFEVAPVMEAGQEIGGPIYVSGGAGAVATSPELAQAVVTASGAIDQTKYNHLIDSTAGALALTLGAPTSPRQRLRFQFIVDGGGGTNDATLTFNGTSTIVCADLGDYFELQHNGAEWIPMVLVNLVDGTIPVYTP